MIHGDSIISGVQEEKPDKRPQCAWPVKKEGVDKPCGSEERIYTVKGNGKWTGRPRETPICDKHIEKAIKDWKWDSIEPL